MAGAHQEEVEKGLTAAARWLEEQSRAPVRVFREPELIPRPPEVVYVVHVLVGTKPRTIKFREHFLADCRNRMADALEASGLMSRLADAAGPIVIPAE